MSSLELPQFAILEFVDKVPSVLVDLQEGSNSQFRFRAPHPCWWYFVQLGKENAIVVHIHPRR